MVEPKTLSGFMELLPDEQIQFNNIKAIIQKNYEKFGFLPLDTPVLESSEVLLAKAGGETEKQIYRFSKGDNNNIFSKWHCHIKTHTHIIVAFTKPINLLFSFSEIGRAHV